MNTSKTVELLRHAAERAVHNSFFLAADLEQFRLHRRMTESDLARFLGCPSDALPKVALCRRPGPQTPRFQDDVRRIASGLGLDLEQLARLLREVDALRALSRVNSGERSVGGEGLLMAARDQEATEPEGGDAPSGVENPEEGV